MKSLILAILVILCACTYSVNLVHTQGEASDVVDETQTAQPDIKPTLTIPAV